MIQLYKNEELIIRDRKRYFKRNTRNSWILNLQEGWFNQKIKEMLV